MPEGKPLIVQSDQTILVDVHDPSFEDARASLGTFAHLDKSPEHLHSYRIDALSLWNAASSGITPEAVISSLERWTRYEIPQGIIFYIKDTMSRFGKVRMRESDIPNVLSIVCADPTIRAEILSSKGAMKLLRATSTGFDLDLVDRGNVKLALIKLGYPVEDEAPLADGDPFSLGFLPVARSGKTFGLRPYQIDAACAFLGDGNPGNGYGVIVLPCGAGKTVVGMEIMRAIGRKTLVITTNVAAVHQWMDELADKTDVRPEDIGEYTGDAKEIRPITIATYQVLVWRPDKNSEFPHFGIFRKEKWGLIVYDEVHLLPAPVFRVVAEIQSIKRLGLTATLVREDGLESDVFTLIGPKKCDVPWKDLEKKGFIAEAYCREIRVPLSEEDHIRYASSESREKIRIAAENPVKHEVLRELIANHPTDRILVIGQYLSQLGKLAKEIDAPLVTGSVPNAERERIYSAFKKGDTRIIVASKVANFAIDLPDASVAIQVSGGFGSRQEEAQRLGRILRPKDRNSYFYSIVSRYTVEEEFSSNRRKFLAEQGYRYTIEAWDEKL